jgi:hypothetical protein
MGQKGASLSVDRLLHQFEKTGGRGEYCGPFQDLPAAARDSLTASANFTSDEQPVIACFFNEDRWTLLTSKRLVWRDGPELHAVASAELTSATVSQDHLLKAGSKKAMTELSIGTAAGGAFHLRLEPGRPFFGFWNVLKLVAR